MSVKYLLPEAEVKAEIRQAEISQAYTRIQKDLEFLVMATPTGKAREDLTSARIYLEKAKISTGRCRV